MKLREATAQYPTRMNLGCLRQLRWRPTYRLPQWTVTLSAITAAPRGDTWHFQQEIWPQPPNLLGLEEEWECKKRRCKHDMLFSHSLFFNQHMTWCSLHHMKQYSKLIQECKRKETNRIQILALRWHQKCASRTRHRTLYYVILWYTVLSLTILNSGMIIFWKKKCVILYSTLCCCSRNEMKLADIRTRIHWVLLYHIILYFVRSYNIRLSSFELYLPTLSFVECNEMK